MKHKDAAGNFGYGGDPVMLVKERPGDYTGPRYNGFQAEIASDALLVHWAECCAPTHPCPTAAFYMLATGRVEGATGCMTPDLRASGGQVDGAYRYGAKAADDKDAPRTTHRRRTCTGAGAKRARNAIGMATQRQRETIAQLLVELAELGDSDEVFESATLVGGRAAVGMGRELLYGQIDSEAWFKDRTLTFKRASALLDALIPAAREWQDKQGATQREREHAGATAELTEGMYQVDDGTIYRVKRAESGWLYAQRLVQLQDGGKPRFARAPGAIRQIRSEHRMSAASAKAFGRRFGFCICCARLLTKRDSIDRGIGPICAQKV